ncbi:hypothetical protein LB505_001498 [Fusarium chuoi]|nr:hypothetical protein LB505_001498 [Fusarium chuoi]
MAMMALCSSKAQGVNHAGYHLFITLSWLMRFVMLRCFSGVGLAMYLERACRRFAQNLPFRLQNLR